MALQFILGSSGSGKSSYIFQQMIEKSKEEPETGFFIVVPEQFTMQTQRELVSRQKNHGIMNIDVVSFQRLAYRVFDELGLKNIKVLEETGKNFILRRVAEENMEQLQILKGNLKKAGYINEMKSIISEMAQYRVTTNQLEEFLENESQPALFRYRLADIRCIYQGFLDYLRGNYVTAEQILEVLAEEAGRSAILKDCVMVLDGFTGFTPIQYHLLEQLMRRCRELYVTVTLDQKEASMQPEELQELFYMSKKTIRNLSGMARRVMVEIGEPVWMDQSGPGRFSHAPQLKWLEQNLFRYRPQVYRGKEENISMYCLPNPRQELMFAAGEICRLVREEGYRYRDMAVVCGDVELYGNYVHEVFEGFQIPVFVDKKNQITFHPLTEMIRNMLLVIEQDFSYESVFAYLRCGLSGIERERIDQLENYVLANRLRGYSVWQNHWVRISGADGADELAEVNEARAAVAGQFAPVRSLLKSSDTTVLQKTVALYEFIFSLGIQAKLEKKGKELEEAKETAAAREYAQIYKIVMDLLDKLTQLLEQDKMELREYREILEAGFEAAAVGIIPPGYDQVVLGDIERTRLSHVKILFFVGVNDGLIPKSTQSSGLITQQERELLAENKIELAPGLRERAFIQKFYLYLSLTKPSDHLYVTWFWMSGDGKEARKSYLVGVLQKMFPSIEVKRWMEPEELNRIVTPKGSRRVFSEGLQRAKNGAVSPAFRALYQWYCSHGPWAEEAERLLDAAFSAYQKQPMNPEITRALYGAVLENSVTRLERFSACAYAHFMAYGIGVKERMLGEFAPVDMGSLFHAALEYYAGSMEEKGCHWFDVPEELRDSLTEEAAAKAAADFGSMIYSDARTAYTMERIKRILRRTVDTIGAQLQQSSFAPEGYEISFSFAQDLESVNFTLSEEEKMRLKGRIDRMDTKAEGGKIYVKVVDYKSGNTQFQLVSLYHGLQLQLVVYLNAAVEIMKRKYPEKDIEPSGMFYYHMEDPVIEVKGQVTEEEVREKVLEQLKLNGIGLSDNDGSVSRKSQTAGVEELKLLSSYVNHKIKSIGKEIYRGNIEVNPYMLKDKTGCDYCPYHGICGFDEKLPGYGYHKLPDIKEKDVILEKMREEI